MNKPTSSFYRGPIWLNHGLAKCSPFTAMLLLIGVVFAAEEKDFIPDRIVTYKTASEFELQLHIFNPHGHAATDQRPAIVFFFGGGWSGGTPKQFYQQAREVADLGMVAIPADYRVKSRNKTSPFESVADAKSAIRWVRQHAKELGVDPNKIVGTGGSAGGHVAACTGVIEGNEEAGEDLSIYRRARVVRGALCESAADHVREEKAQRTQSWRLPYHAALRACIEKRVDGGRSRFCGWRMPDAIHRQGD